MRCPKKLTALGGQSEITYLNPATGSEKIPSTNKAVVSNNHRIVVMIAHDPTIIADQRIGSNFHPFPAIYLY